MSAADDIYRAQHQKRLNHMPWLYFSLKPKHKAWATVWQNELQTSLAQLESIHFSANCFVASNANIFAEPGRDIYIGEQSFIGANCYLHGPINIGRNVSINQQCLLEGSKAGISIGDNTRIAAGCSFYAFEHGIEPNALVADQPISSKGIRIGCDVWIGANCGLVDGVAIGDHAVIGMNSTITKEVEAFAIMAGTPARKIGDRREKPITTYSKTVGADLSSL